MKTSTVAGGGGTQLHVVEKGNPNGKPILFIHGVSQCWLTWLRQLDSPLGDNYRLVAMDLRGHGKSEKPRDGYGDSRLWADDVHGVIAASGLDHPLLCSWSYGSLVILDYLRYYGEDAIRGVNFVGGVTKLGGEEAAAVFDPAFFALVPGFCSTDVETSLQALNGLLKRAYAQELSAEDHYRMLGYNATVPPHVRQGLLSRAIDNDDLLPKLRKPFLITQGMKDAVVKSSVISEQMNKIKHARIQLIEEAGHACFWEIAETFNQNLSEFIESIE